MQALETSALYPEQEDSFSIVLKEIVSEQLDA